MQPLGHVEPRRIRIRIRDAAVIGAAVAAALLLAGCKPDQSAPAAAVTPPFVSVVTIHAQPVAIMTELPGRMSGYRIADVRPQVSGLVLKRLFVEGDDVRQGQQLYQIDPSPYQASLDSAKAAVQKARAAVTTARLKMERDRPLVKALAVTAQDLDDAVATLKQNEADVASGLASVATANINLAYTKVYSPISGRTGRSSVTEGALVTANQTASLVTVTQLDPIYVDVTQPVATLLRFKRELKSGQLKGSATDAAVQLILEDGRVYPQEGRLQFSEVNVDQSTGSVTLRAIFPNPEEALLPAMFVRMRIQEGIDPHGLLVPQRGVTHNQRGQPTALVVGKDGKVERRTLIADLAIGDSWLVAGGIADGDRVIIAGLQKVRPGMAVLAQEQPAETAGGADEAADDAESGSDQSTAGN